MPKFHFCVILFHLYEYQTLEISKKRAMLRAHAINAVKLPRSTKRRASIVLQSECVQSTCQYLADCDASSSTWRSQRFLDTVFILWVYLRRRNPKHFPDSHNFRSYSQPSTNTNRISEISRKRIEQCVVLISFEHFIHIDRSDQNGSVRFRVSIRMHMFTSYFVSYHFYLLRAQIETQIRRCGRFIHLVGARSMYSPVVRQ